MQNLILIDGVSYIEIRKALKQWIELYSNSLDDNLIFKLHKNGENKHVILVDEKIDNESFYYLINYLKYPENITYKIEIIAYLHDDDNRKLKGKDLLIYIPNSDVEYDNVYFVTPENIHFKFTFGRKIIEINDNKLFSEQPILSLSIPEILKVKKKIIVENTSESEQRFKLGSLILLLFFILSLIVHFLSSDKELFFILTSICGGGFTLWIYSDYKMLRNDTLYLKALILSMLLFIYGILLKMHFKDETVSFLDFGLFNSMILLLVQKPLRKLYLKLVKKEPETDTKGSFTLAIYSIILILLAIIIPLLISIKFK